MKHLAVLTCLMYVLGCDHTQTGSSQRLPSPARQSTTEDLHALPAEATEKFLQEDPYGESRRSRDYTYHKYYNLERQKTQNALITTCLQNGITAERPYLIFTAGVMGSGKTHTMNNPDLRKYLGFPFQPVDFLYLDPDRIKYMLPEAKRLIRDRDPAMGNITHKESGFIQEIVFAEALKRSKNTIFDGSFRNKGWHEALLTDIRRRFPHYQLGLIYITADRNYIEARLQKRYKETARLVTLEDALRYEGDIFNSVQALRGRFDFFLQLKNNAILEHSLPLPGTRKANRQLPPFFPIFLEFYP